MALPFSLPFLFGLREKADKCLRVVGDLLLGQVGVDLAHGLIIGPAADLHGDLLRHIQLVSKGSKAVPLRYNYDKPEKPRISRVFGYQARFFILFQPEKSSREVVIS